MGSNPWPEFNVDEGPRLPRRILAEEGAKIAERTNDLIRFAVRTTGGGGDFQHLCELSVPSIGYTYPLFRVHHGPRPYPLTVISEAVGGEKKVENEGHLMGTLVEIFSSELTRSVVRQLLDLAAKG